MRRNPSPEVGRSETTAELIARISAERDAPLRSTGRHAIITAPPRAAAPARSTAPPRTTGAPQLPRPRRPAADRAASPDTDPRMRAYRPPPHVVDDEPSELRTGPIDLTGLGRAPVGPVSTGPVPVQRAGSRIDPDIPRPRREPALAVVVDDVLHDPAADDTPTGGLQLVAPDTPAPRRTVRLVLSAALVAVAMVLVGAAAAGWFGGTGPTAPADPGAVVASVGGVGVVPEPAPTGPTVPAPVNGPPPATAPDTVVPAPAGAPADPAGEVQLTGGAVPPADPYGY